MNDTVTPFGNPDEHTNGTSTASSIVNNLLDLDELLSADVRLAEKVAIFYTRPDLEARMEVLNAELAELTDAQGRPLTPVDASMVDGVRSAHVVNQEYLAVEAEYAASKRVVQVRQINEDDWAAFLQRHKDVLADDPPYPAAFYEDLIVRSNARLVEPSTAKSGEPSNAKFGEPFTAEQVRELRNKLGHPAFNGIFQAAWAVNSQSGVSVPKSWLSSAVQRHTEHG